jgi:hypothetical protein
MKIGRVPIAIHASGLWIRRTMMSLYHVYAGCFFNQASNALAWLVRTDCHSSGFQCTGVTGENRLPFIRLPMHWRDCWEHTAIHQASNALAWLVRTDCHSSGFQCTGVTGENRLPFIRLPMHWRDWWEQTAIHQASNALAWLVRTDFTKLHYF